MTKTSPLSFSKHLTQEQREELYDLLHTQGKTLAEGVTWCEGIGVKTSRTSLSDWLKRYRLIRKVEGFDTAATEMEERLVKRGIDPLLAPKLAQQGFLLQAAEAEDAETFLAMASLIQRHVEFEAAKQEHADIMDIKRTQSKQRDRALEQAQEKVEQAERKLQLMEKKMKDAGDLVEDKELTAEEKVNRWKEIFGR